MRTIEFRGKCIVTGVWQYGYYVKDPKGKSRIYWQPFTEASSNTYIFVIPETVGQFTGLTDKNGNKIFEGDVIGWIDFEFIVKWVEYDCRFYGSPLPTNTMNGELMANTFGSSVVIGNIHSND